MKRVALDDIQYEPRLGHEKAVIFGDEDFGSKTKVQIVKLPANEHVKPHVHKVRTELLQVLAGTGEIVVNNEIAATKAGEFVLVEPNDVHEVINRGDEPFIVAVFRTNDPGDEDMMWVEEA